MLRFGLLVSLLVIAAVLVAFHGLRGVLFAAIAGAVLLGLSSRRWRRVESLLEQLTGSRRRAYGLLLGILIVLVAAVNIVQLAR
jgi:hypothetical protein